MDGYFFHDGNEQYGPFTLEELKEKSIKRETPVWKKGLRDWARASDLPELNSIFENTPPAFRKQDSSTASKKHTLTEKTGQKLGKFLGWTGLFRE
jgi:hypothetical protein